MAPLTKGHEMKQMTREDALVAICSRARPQVLWVGGPIIIKITLPLGCIGPGVEVAATVDHVLRDLTSGGTIPSPQRARR